MHINKLLTILLIISVAWSCKTQKKVDEVASQKEIINIDYTAGPTTYIYKTKGDYNDKVPVTLSEDRTEIVSFPSPKDLYYKGKLAYPTQLDGGYLLDNRGISANVAFLNITYEKYSKLDSTPATESLFALILDNDPLLELYDCGNRYQYKDEVAELNSIINNEQLDQCKKVK